MDVITIKQPWAFLVVEGIKDIENRTWPCPPKRIGERVLIHAGMDSKLNLSVLNSKQYDYACLKVLEKGCIQMQEVKNWTRGAIIGSVVIADCVINHPSIWAEHWATKHWHNGVRVGFYDVQCYNWVLKDPIKFPEPIPAKGKLSFWNYPNILAVPDDVAGYPTCNCQLHVKETDQVDGDSHFGYRCKYCGGIWYK